MGGCFGSSCGLDKIGTPFGVRRFWGFRGVRVFGVLGL